MILENSIEIKCASVFMLSYRILMAGPLFKLMQNIGKNVFYCTVNSGICKLFVKTKTGTSQIPLVLAHGCMFLEDWLLTVFHYWYK